MKTGDKLGRYELGKPIGEGAMSEVFASRHPLLERDVAIKVLKKEVCSDQQYVARFLDDARAAHALNHPNIVRVLDVDDSEAQPFIVMDLVDGQPLDEWRKGQVELPVAVKIARDVAGALAAAHAAGMVHRDVKPSNVLLERKTKMAKLTDFGAAKREREDGAQLTQMGQRIGTPRYMAPEQVEGGEVSKCTDLFALGALLYELIAGRPAFEGETVSAVFHGILFKDPRPLGEVRPEVPAPLSELVGRLLAKKPEDRPASAEEVVAALDGLDQAAPTGVARNPAAAGTDATQTGMTATGMTGATATGATSTGAAAGAGASAASRTGATPPAHDTAGEAPPPPPYVGASKTFGGIMERSRLVPIAAGVVLLLVVVGGGFWAFSGGDAPDDVAAGEESVAVTEGDAGEEPSPAEETAGDTPPAAVAEAEPQEEPEEPEPAPDEPDIAVAEPEAPDQQPAAGGADGAATDRPSADATDQAGGGSDSGAPSFAQSLREEDQQQGSGQDLAALPEEEPTGGDQPEAAGAGPPSEPATGQEEQAGQFAEPAPVEEEESGSEAQVAVVRPDEAPDLPDDEGAETAALDCAADEPGCAFAETVLAAVQPDTATGPEIFLNKDDGVYLDQEYLVVEVSMPEEFGGYLYLDVYTDNGEVFHLLPEPLREDNRLRQGAMIRVGVEEDERATGIRHWQISGPFGTGYLVALVSENPLFDDLRPIGESIESYRPVLLDALDDPETGRTAFSVTPVEFRPR